MKKLLYTRITEKTIALFLFAFLLLSRASITTTVNFIPLNTTVVQVAYSGCMFMLYAFEKIKRNEKFGTFHISTFLSILLAVYIVVFGKVFINPPLAQYTNGIFMRQTLFLLVVFSTVAVICVYHLFDGVLLTAYYVFSFIILFQFLTNITDIAQLNVATVFNDSERARVTYGFSHYNALGAFCICYLMIWIILRKRDRMPFGNKWINYLTLLVSVIMLFGSASRNAISGFIIFSLCYLFMMLRESKIGQSVRFFVECAIAIIVVLFFSYGLTGLSFSDLLNQSNRETLLEVALPTFLKSGRMVVGLGLASNEIYGLNQTPYKTYWLDNSYVYVLITSGYLGCVFYVTMIIILFVGLNRVANHALRKVFLSLAIMYMYSAMFETTLFWAGVMQNYIYMIIFLVALSGFFNNPSFDKNIQYISSNNVKR